MVRLTRLERATTVLAALVFPAMALSVSATHILLGATFLAAALQYVLGDRRRAPDQAAPSPAARLFFLAGAAYFAWLILVALAGVFRAEDPLAALRRIPKSECGDLPMFLFAVLIWRMGRRAENFRILGAGFIALLVLIVLTGDLGAFSEFRLSRLARGAGFVASAWNRPQHPAFAWGDLQLYRSVGMMNTRLTYAGLLLIILPHLIAGALYPQSRRWRALYFCLAIGGIFALFVNGTRSAWIGFVAAAILSTVVYLRDRRPQADFALQLRHLWQRAPLATGLAAAALLVCVLAGGLRVWPAANTAAWKIYDAQDRHTDFYRPILWTGAGALIAAQPLAGAGPGNFETATRAWRSEYLRTHPELWYFFENAPAMHAHNDLLHIAAVAGLPAALLFLCLPFALGRELFLRQLNAGPRAHDLRNADDSSAANPEAPADAFARGDYLLCALLGFFIAGLAQCYFQDDETVVLLWSAAALALSGQSFALRGYRGVK